jgi:sulfite exporter TauE/SafE
VPTIIETLTIPAALAAGFAGSAHCAAMCGGIAAAAGASFRAGGGLPMAQALAFNAARLAGYALLGALLAGLFGAIGAGLPLRDIAWGGRLFAVAIMVALALRLLTGHDLLGLERVGGVFWRRLKPAFTSALRLPAPLRCAAMGLLWGFLPCGLVYSVLLMAAATGAPLTAAATMVVFGIGTLPPLLGLTLGAASLGELLRRPGVRRAAGLAVLVCAAWSLVAMPGRHAAPAGAATTVAGTAADCH